MDLRLHLASLTKNPIKEINTIMKRRIFMTIELLIEQLHPLEEDAIANMQKIKY